MTIDLLNLPTIAFISFKNIFAKGKLCFAIDGNIVVIIQDDQFAQLDMAGESTGLVRNTLLEVTITGKHIGVVVDNLVFLFIVARRQRSFSKSKAKIFAQSDTKVSFADVAGIDFVVVEILVPEQPVLVSHQAVLGDRRGVELDLDLDVLGDGHQRAAELLQEDPLRLAIAVDVAFGDLRGIDLLVAEVTAQVPAMFR